MRKSLVVLLGLLHIPFMAFSAERVVVLEVATGTWCGHCPKVAATVEGLAQKYPGQLLIVEYHHQSSDPFSNPDGEARIDYYAVSGYPTSYFDGTEKLVGDGGITLARYDPAFLAHRGNESPLEIEFSGEKNSYTSASGTLQAHITNTNAETITGKVHFTITESHIPYSWIGEDSLFFVERRMLPDPDGLDITLTSGADTTLTCDYTIDDGWPHFTENESCDVGCFVQGPDKQIHQAAVLKFAAIGVEETAPISYFVSASTILNRIGQVDLLLETTRDIDLVLCDACGRSVKTLHTGSLSAGIHHVEIDASILPKGVYFLKLTSSGHSDLKKLIVVH
ncbi:T9SS type A sorting domain-containing protein [candidate division WOR-3 bacterium]|nr:T9SS type A sorting domain-containing protein [candidate division WOR-3 bacterium]